MSVKLLFIGTAGAVSSGKRDNTSMAIRSNNKIILVEATGASIHKMLKAGFDPLEIEYIFITHMHPDHSYGLPSLLHELGMMRKGINVKVMIPEPFAEDMGCVLDRFGVLPDNGLISIPLENKKIVDRSDLVVESFPVLHTIPNVGLKFVFQEGCKSFVLVYSSDTEFCDSVVAAAKDADILVHECNESVSLTGGKVGHSTAEDAGRVAALSGVKVLALVHLGPALLEKPELAVSEARRQFNGNVFCPEDLDVVEF